MNSNKVKWNKSIFLVMLGIVALLANANTSFAQAYHKHEVIQPMRLFLSDHQTTNLVFPYAIKSVDRGSIEVLVQKAVGVENILQVKAAYEDMGSTNLTVVTADGSLYSYIVYYRARPSILNIRMERQHDASRPQAVFTDRQDHEAPTTDMAKTIVSKHRSVKGIKDKQFKVAVRLIGIYIQDDRLFFQLSLENNSTVQYDISQLRFYIRDKKRSKRTASQELELPPLYTQGSTQLIQERSSHNIVVALEKFTIQDKKYLTIELLEEHGGRHLELKVQNKDIINAIPIE